MPLGLGALAGAKHFRALGHPEPGMLFHLRSIVAIERDDRVVAPVVLDEVADLDWLPRVEGTR